MSDLFLCDTNSPLQDYLEDKESLHSVYHWWDRCLHPSMLSDAGNAFAAAYYEPGTYFADYAKVLQGELPSELHVVYSEENYRLLKPRLDQRFREWTATGDRPST